MAIYDLLCAWSESTSNLNIYPDNGNDPIHVKEFAKLFPESPMIAAFAQIHVDSCDPDDSDKEINHASEN